MKVLYSKKNGITNKLSGVNLPVDADEIDYDNTESELQSTNVQDAIDEVVDIVADKVDKVMGKGLSTNDYDNTDKAKVGKIDETTTSVTGNPISISGLKSNQLAINPVITLEPIQAGSGDPSPSNVRAISGYDKIEVLSCGKNLVGGFVAQTGTSITVTKNGNSYTITGSSAGAFINTKLKANKTYKLSYTLTSGTVDNVRLYDDLNATTFIVQITSGDVITPPQDCYVRFWLSGTIVLSNVQIEVGDQATTYEPYHKTTDLSLQIGQTICGGSLDLRTGVLTVDKGYTILDGSSDETWMVYDSSLPVYLCTIGGTPEFASSPKHVISDKFKYVYAVWDNYTNPWCFSDHPLVENTYYSVDPSVIHNETEMRNWLANNPVTVIRYLATPFTIQLTPHEISLLKDYAYVSTNGTNMSFSYHNGEMASLGDVAQLGQTVNELGNVVKYRTPVHMLKIFEHYVNDMYFYLPIWWDIQYGGYIVDSLLVNNSQNNYRYNFTLRWYNGTVTKTYETLNDSPSDNLTFTVLW